MSLGINKVIIAGELYADPTLRSFPTGGLIANFMLVTKEDVKDKTTGEIKEYNRYHKVSALGRLAEFVKEEAFKKDEMLLVEGSLRTRILQKQRRCHRLYHRNFPQQHRMPRDQTPRTPVLRKQPHALHRTLRRRGNSFLEAVYATVETS